MTLSEYLQQESGIRPHVHFHEGVWWRRSSWGCCRPLYPLQEIPPGSARPGWRHSLIRYSYVIPASAATPGHRDKTRLMLQGEALKNYTLQNIPDRKRRQAINKAVRCGVKIKRIQELERHRDDLHQIYVTNAARNRHGLPEHWYLEHEKEWWSNLSREYDLQGRDWFGAFQEDKLVAFLYGCLVDDTAVMLVAKSHRDYLVSDPNDLLLFEVCQYNKERPECRRIDVGWMIHVPPSIDWRKRSLGFEPVELPVFQSTNSLVMGVIRGSLRIAGPLLGSETLSANRGLRFRAQVIGKRLDDWSRGEG